MNLYSARSKRAIAQIEREGGKLSKKFERQTAAKAERDLPRQKPTDRSIPVVRRNI